MKAGKHLYILAIFTFSLACLCFTTSCNTQNAGQEVHVRIFSTADVHAYVFPYDFIEGHAINHSLAHVHSLVSDQRSKKGKHVVLLDNGDILQGQPTGFYYNFIATEEEHLIGRVLNFMQYDAATVGNHDIEAGPEVYKTLPEVLDFPWLSANINHIKSGEPFFEPYTIIERNGVRIAVIGLTTTGVPNWLPRRLWESLEFVDMYTAAKHYVSYIRDNERPDAIIGLFHSGAGPEMEYDPGSDLPNNASRYIAQYVPGFDVIFTSHDHRERNEVVTNKDGDEVLLIAGLPYAESVGVADLWFTIDESNGFSLIRKKGELISVKSYEPCKDFMATFKKEKNTVLDYVNQPLGELENRLSSRDGFFGNSAFTDFIHRVQIEVTGADISFAAPLSFDRELKKGPVKMSDMFKLYPFENYLYVMELTGKEIIEFLEYSYGLWFNTMQGEDDHLLLFRKDREGNLVENNEGNLVLSSPFYNFDSAYGIDYTVDVSQTPDERITVEQMSDGKTFHTDKTYKVAINSYRGSGGGGHLTEGAGISHADLERRIAFASENEMRTIIADYIKQKETLSPQKTENWEVIPKHWAQKATEKDRKLLFGKQN